MPIKNIRAGVVAMVAGAALLPVSATAASAQLASGAAQVRTASGMQVASICSSRDKHRAERLSADIRAAVRGRHGTISVSVHDRRTGTTCDLAGGTRYQTASIVKVSILSALLRKRGAHGLTRQEKQQATAMITRSDNDAATALWRATGPTAFNGFLSAAGMRQTSIDASGYWGKTHTTSTDQIRLLDILTAKNQVLTNAARSYVLGLMAKVVAGQRWGTPVGAPAGTVVHVKNGWVDRGDSAHWRINSIGSFSGHGRDYMITVLTQRNPTEAYGHATIEAIATRIHRDLN